MLEPETVRSRSSAHGSSAHGSGAAHRTHTDAHRRAGAAPATFCRSGSRQATACSHASRRRSAADRLTGSRTQCAEDPAELRNRSRPATVRSRSHADAEQPTGRAEMHTEARQQHPPHFAGVDPDRPQRAATQAAAAL